MTAEEKAIKLLERERLSVTHNAKWLSEALTEARLDALEEAAKHFDAIHPWPWTIAADHVRRLKGAGRE